MSSGELIALPLRRRVDNGISRRKYALVDRPGFSNETRPLELGLWDKSNYLAHVSSKSELRNVVIK